MSFDVSGPMRTVLYPGGSGGTMSNEANSPLNQSKQLAMLNFQGQGQLAQQGYAAQGSLAGQQNAAQRQSAADAYNYQTGLAGQQNTATSQLSKQQADQQASLDRGNYANQQSLAKTQQQTSEYQSDQSLAAAKYPVDYKQGVFNTLWPWLQGQLGGAGGSTSGYASSVPVGGGGVSGAPIWSPQQIQQQVNAGRASGDASTQNQMRQIQQDTAGRGFGGNSPLAQALQGQAQAANVAGNTANERQTRWNAAQGNAQQALSAGQANAQLAAAQQAEVTKRLGLDQQYRSTLLSAVLGDF